MTAAPGLIAGLLRALARPFRMLSSYGAVLAVLAAAALVAVLAYAGISSLVSGGGSSAGPREGIVDAGSSWITGQPSLAASPLFGAIEHRAVALAQDRWNARQALIAQIAAARKAAELKRREDLLRKYAELRARELAAYRAQLLKIEHERAVQAAKLAAARKKYAEELAAYMRARTVTPGQECNDPLVRKYYSCANGLLPVHP